MTKNTKHTVAGDSSVNYTHEVKHYGESSFVVKKTQEAKETLQKFPVPDKYDK